MLIHKKIREELTALLEADINLDAAFYAGRPVSIDLENQPIAIVVLIDKATRQKNTLCDDEWAATLSVVIYHKSFEGEGKLDDIAEQIIHLLENVELKHLASHELVQYEYEKDTQQRMVYR
ncbi:phage tail terminator protein [Conservatibacter flavescens]|uniref:Phage tail protein n=1 Tax=Conservatibacter flavescens TaxID=28161 RepID=A0A2M8S5M2_9PAST|nr:phage tail terminator protein [Conservatibacter flavescens]PJG86437.1 phage tail protein [Conservatibacter flavescens]